MVDADVQEFIERWPEVSKEFASDMPSLMMPTLLAGAVGAAFAALTKRNPAKWGIAFGGAALAAGVIAETAFAFGAGAGVTVAVQQCNALKPGEHLSWRKPFMRAPIATSGMYGPYFHPNYW
jgi:hypothetical protein